MLRDRPPNGLRRDLALGVSARLARKDMEEYMRRKSLLRLSVLGFIAPIAGCAILTDTINPDLLSGFGFDPETIVPSQGRVVVVYNNQTDFQVEFHSVSLDSTFTAGSEDTTTVEPDGTGNTVFECPVEALVPSQLTAAAGDGAIFDRVGAIVATGAAQAQVAYAGAVLLQGQDFFCGDVIEIRLNQVGAGGDQNQVNFRLSIFVRPGR